MISTKKKSFFGRMTERLEDVLLMRPKPDEEMLEELPLFIDMVLIENIVDKLECCAREGEAPDPEDIEGAAGCLIDDIPYAGFGST